jgi:hypothetical protein
MMLFDLADVIRAGGLKVIEVPGWKTRTRPAKSGHDDGLIAVRTITCHHTANGGADGNYPSYNTVLHGRGEDLPGPLAQLGLAKDGTVYVFAAGIANHAGVSLKEEYDKYHAIGIEAEAIGVPGAEGDWPKVQMTAYHRLCKILAVRYKVPNDHILGHKETASPRGRKSDPSFSMPDFREAVAALDLNEDEITMADVDELVEKIWARLETFTPAAANAAGDPALEGTKARMDTLVQFPPAVARLRREADARFDALVDQVSKVKMQSDRLEAALKKQAEYVTKLEGTLAAQTTTLGEILAKVQSILPPPAG